MPILENFFKRARANPARVVLPELDDPRVAQAAEVLLQEGLAEPIGLAVPSEAHIEALVAARGMKPAIAKRMIAKPLFRAAAMVAAGEADVMVAGADSPTKKVIEAASIGIGLSSGVATPSSFFLMIFPDGREMIFADCAVNVAPDAAALGDIARASHATGEALLGSAKTALLSFSTDRSGQGASVDLVREVAEATGFTGPVQADAALNPTIARKKEMGDGDANVLVFPDLNSGNIGYKLCQEFAGAQAIGPFLQGFAKPVCDLSRGATVDDIVASAVVAIAMA